MKITEVKVKQISELLIADADRAKELLALSPEEALVEINGGLNGNFITLIELQEFGKMLQEAAKISDHNLATVSGGAGSDDKETDSLLLAAAIIGGGALGAAATYNW